MGICPPPPSTNLEENSEEDEGNGACNKQWFVNKGLRGKEVNEREGNGSSKTTVTNNELVLEWDWDHAEPVHQKRLEEDSCKSEENE